MNKILIVEDGQGQAGELRHILEIHGFDAQIVRAGDDTVEIFCAGVFDRVAADAALCRRMSHDTQGSGGLVKTRAYAQGRSVCRT